jgi:hypothetical protein
VESHKPPGWNLERLHSVATLVVLLVEHMNPITYKSWIQMDPSVAGHISAYDLRTTWKLRQIRNAF